MKRILLIVLSFLFLFAAACSPDTGASNYRVSLSRTEASLEEGESVQLSAAVEQSGTEVEAEVTWKSSDPSVATVSGGNVTAVQAGSAVITATYEGAEAACVLTVTKYYQPQLRIKLNYSDVRFTGRGRRKRFPHRSRWAGKLPMLPSASHPSIRRSPRSAGAAS